MPKTDVLDLTVNGQRILVLLDASDPAKPVKKRRAAASRASQPSAGKHEVAPAVEGTEGVLPDPSTVPFGTVLRGIKAADGKRRRQLLWFRGLTNGQATWNYVKGQ